MQEEDVAPGAADREHTRAVSLGVEKERREWIRYALLVVLAAIQRQMYAVCALLETQ